MDDREGDDHLGHPAEDRRGVHERVASLVGERPTGVVELVEEVAAEASEGGAA
jgi:hypothetical protein